MSSEFLKAIKKVGVLLDDDFLPVAYVDAFGARLSARTALQLNAHSPQGIKCLVGACLVEFDDGAQCSNSCSGRFCPRCCLMPFRLHVGIKRQLVRLCHNRG